MQIDGNTRLVGIVADPIAHVRTPQMFNAAVARHGVNVVCVPLHVSAELLPQLLKGVTAAQNLLGFVVTIPHQDTVEKYCGALTPSAQLRSEEHTSELQSLMRISYAVFCLKKK